MEAKQDMPSKVWVSFVKSLPRATRIVPTPDELTPQYGSGGRPVGAERPLKRDALEYCG